MIRGDQPPWIPQKFTDVMAALYAGVFPEPGGLDAQPADFAELYIAAVDAKAKLLRRTIEP